MTSRKRPFLAGLILCEQRPGSITYLKACNPPNFNFSNDLGIIVNNAFPPTKPETNIVYAFNTQSYICFDLVIVLPDILYSIILLTRIKMPNVYISFLQELNKTFSLIGNDSFDPLPLFDYTYSLLCSWKWVSQTKFFAQYPDDAYYIEIDNDSFCYASFDPLAFFQGSDTLIEIWKSVITGAGLHIICDDPEVLSSATFAAQSIVSPLLYRDQVLITFNPEDERFKDIDNYCIVATTPNVDLTPIRNFKYTVEAKKTSINLNSSSSKKLREEIKAKTKRVVEINVFMMDRMLRKNPFNDLLEGPYMTDDADPLFEPKKNKKMPILLPNEYRMVETTETFRNYRRKIMYRNTFRQYFLSIKPEEALNQQSLQHLKVLESKFKELENIFSNDIHFISVLRVHMSITKKLLTKFNANSPKKTANPVSNKNQPPKDNPSNTTDLNDNNSNEIITTDTTNDNDNNNTNNMLKSAIDPNLNSSNVTKIPKDIKNISDTNTSNPGSSVDKTAKEINLCNSPDNGNNDFKNNIFSVDANNQILRRRSTDNSLYLFRMNDDEISLSCNFLDQGNDVSYDTDEKIRTLSDPHIQPHISNS